MMLMTTMGEPVCEVCGGLADPRPLRYGARLHWLCPGCQADRLDEFVRTLVALYGCHRCREDCPDPVLVGDYEQAGLVIGVHQDCVKPDDLPI